MAAEKIIGVDFGTSTSVIRVKRYQDGEPVGGRLEKMEVRFSGSAMVPTAVQRLPSGESVYFGFDAEIPHKKLDTQSYSSFKMELESPEPAVRERARSLTRDYFAYLGREYLAQRDGGHLGEMDDTERTIVSYPVKWDQDARDFLLQAARDAGFPNVEGLDEARAAIQAVTVQNAHLLRQKGYFKAGVPVNILLMDMGAGTTDLVLCRHTPGDNPKTDILATWPREGGVFFGGREVDELLRGYIRQALPRDSADSVLSRVSLSSYKAWKEKTVSESLKRGETVDYFAALDNILNAMGVDAAYAIDRERFEHYAEGYLRQLPQLINGCLADGGVGGDEVDLVILTGGHSQWYFVPEILTGELSRFGEVDLTKVQADYSRIIPITLPQETVALGLAYQGLKTEYTISESCSFVEKTIAVSHGLFPLPYEPHSHVRPVVLSGLFCTFGVEESGSVITTGSTLFNVSGWMDIVSLAGGSGHTVGLKKDGSVVGVGVNIYGQRNVNGWRDIIAIGAGLCHTVGLKKDGTVIAVGRNQCGQCDVSDWRDIMAIAAGGDSTIGLKKDGTLIATGCINSSTWDISSWRNIVAISCENSHVVGLKEDGSVIAVGNSKYGMCDVSSWQDIVAVAAGDWHTVGLKKDGTVVAVGDKDTGKCDVGDWQDIIAIAAGPSNTIGVKKDGSVVAVGEKNYGQCDVGQWKTVLMTDLFLFGHPIKLKKTPWKLF